MKTGWLAAPAVVVLLSACATTDDPRDGGFISGVQGLSSGAYEQRVREREDNLEKLRAMQQDLEQEGAALEADKRAREQVLARERQKLAQLDSDVRSLEDRLAELGEAGDAGDARVLDLQRRLDGLKGRLNAQARSIDVLEGGGGSANDLEGTGQGDLSDVRRRQLETQRAALQDEYEELLNLTLMLAQ
jgi:chromosome segregation ATPase